MIAIINYGLGNVKAFADVYKHLNIPATIVNHPDDLKGASKVILPGVGAFDTALLRLEISGLRSALDEMVLERHVPALGVCVGMQMFAHASEEGRLPGLGWIAGEVKKISVGQSPNPIRLPHMGWNTIKVLDSNAFLRGLDEDARFYFLHSYYFEPHKNNNCIAVTDYGCEFACAINSHNIYGVQFHPEKSHQWGMQLLRNFAKL